MRRLLPAVLALTAFVFPACKEDATLTVRSLTFKGVTAVNTNELKSVLATRENARLPLIGLAVPWSRTRTFDRTRFDVDLARIEAFYADRGYPDARVSAFDVRVSERQRVVDVTLTIVEGIPVSIAGVQMAGFGVLAERVSGLQQRLPLEVGRPRDRSAIVAARELALNELRDQGFPHARVTADESRAANGRDVIVTLAAQPGPVARFGPVEIVGNRAVADVVIRRQLAIVPGSLYRRSLVLDSQRRLYAMELFQFVNIEALDPDRQDAEVRMRVTVAEGRHQRVNAGVGYGTEEKWRADGEYHHVNFLGDARSAGVHARWSTLDRGVRFDFLQPYLFSPGFSLGSSLQRWYTYTPAYESVVTGARLSVLWRRTARTSWTASVSSERSLSQISPDVLGDPTLYLQLIALGLDPTTGRQEGTLGSIGFDVQRSTVDNLLDPRRGYQAAIHLEDGGRLLPGTFAFHALAADARHYTPVGARTVLAHRMQAGSVLPAGGNPKEVPFSRKYFLGGATSLRGWGRYEVGPLGGDGLPIGGNTMLEFSSEMRVAMRGSLGSVFFVDAGNVWADRGAVGLGELHYDAGAGLRYRTPVGPVRFDVGYQLNPVDGLRVDGLPQRRRWRFHFSIGQAF